MLAAAIRARNNACAPPPTPSADLSIVARPPSDDTAATIAIGTVINGWRYASWKGRPTPVWVQTINGVRYVNADAAAMSNMRKIVKNQKHQKHLIHLLK